MYSIYIYKFCAKEVIYILYTVRAGMIEFLEVEVVTIASMYQ